MNINNLIMQTLRSLESDIDTLYEYKQPNIHMYCFIHLDISDYSLHKVCIQSIVFENLDMLRTKLLMFFDKNNTQFLIDIYIKEGYTKESKYVLFAVTNNRYIEFCSWIKDN